MSIVCGTSPEVPKTGKQLVIVRGDGKTEIDCGIVAVCQRVTVIDDFGALIFWVTNREGEDFCVWVTQTT